MNDHPRLLRCLVVLSWTAPVLVVDPAMAAGTSPDSIATTDDNPSKAPGEAKKGKVYQWKAADGLPYEFYVPKSYDPKQGANLTVVLHGNGLDHRWTFWNHPAGEFRADDIVLSPDGTTAMARSNEFLGKKKDADRLHALLEEFKQFFTIKNTYLYGHSQGSFFVFYYAGEYPKDVAGVCGHASGAWGWSKLGKFGHHQAIGVMHGTRDHIPYGQGLGARSWYREKKYPMVHLNTLMDWPHRPHYLQAALVLAWCEGMTSDDPAAVEGCLETLSDEKVAMGVDWAALYAVASRMAEMDSATAAQKKAARKAADAVDALAEAHVAAIEKSLGKDKPKTLAGKDWPGHLIRFLEDFDQVPAREKFAKDRVRDLKAIEKAGGDAYGDYYKSREKDPAKAFDAGLKMLSTGYLHYRCPEVLEQMQKWEADAKTNKISKKKLAELKKLGAAFEKARKDGFEAYEGINRKARL